ncbi:MAG: hypothetical protein ACF8GE_10270 [Phycisphaerales bacterium JB043]
MPAADRVILIRVVCLVAIGIAVSCAVPTHERASVEPASLPNLIRVAPGVYSGGEPSGDRAFERLRTMGVRTIVSVDGARPDVDGAHRFGMRYVHLPLGYDEISHARRIELASVFAQRSGAVYVHCHHGVHRGPAAVASGLIGSGEMRVGEMIAFMERAGTSPRYVGLFEGVRGSERLDEKLLLDARTLPEVELVSGVASVMTQIDRIFDRIGVVQEAGWAPTADHPDLVALVEAGMLTDAFRRSAQEAVGEYDKREFGELMRQTIERSARLERAIEGGDSRLADELLSQIRADCRACHAAFRD